jgi:hypothetical protein
MQSGSIVKILCIAPFPMATYDLGAVKLNAIYVPRYQYNPTASPSSACISAYRYRPTLCPDPRARLDAPAG